MSDMVLEELAEAAGLIVDWEDAAGHSHQVKPDTLRAVLAALGLPASSPGEIADGRVLLVEQAHRDLPPLLTADVGRPVRLPLRPDFQPEKRWRIVLEQGGAVEGEIRATGVGHALIPPLVQPGYHWLEIGDHRLTLAVAPPSAFGLTDVVGSGAHPWGLVAQLYGLRGTGDGGCGDFSALAEFAEGAGRHGAAAIAISPVHALFSELPERFSPYAPSSRVLLNVLYVDPADAFSPDLMAQAVNAGGLGEELARLEALPLIDWPATARAKLSVLRHLYEVTLRSRFPQAREFTIFRTDSGAALEYHARFEALHAYFLAADHRHTDWRSWPPAYRSPQAPAVEAFAQEHGEEIGFHAFLQWLAHRQLGAAQKAGRAAGMPIGLIADLAVGTDPGGSEVWANQTEMLVGVSAGTPPDLFNRLGQNWGLSTFSPRGLRASGYAGFIAMLRAALTHATGVRIDHAMGLTRLWVVPNGASPAEGVYLRYPLDDLLRLIALESWRHRSIVIGEDLGTVPSGFHTRLAEAGIHGMRVLWFEREEDYFVLPQAWSPHAVAMTTTHDLPTVAGWWCGRDIEWRRLPVSASKNMVEGLERERAVERTALWRAFVAAGMAEGNVPPDDATAIVSEAALRFVGKTPSPLALVPLEDALGSVEQPNLPATIDEHPNWRRRTDGQARDLLNRPDVARRLEALAAARAGK